MYPRTMGELRRSYGRAGLALLAFTLTVYALGVALLVAGEAAQWWGMDRTLAVVLLNDAVLTPAGLAPLWLILRRNPTPKLNPSPPPSLGRVCEAFVMGTGMLYLGSIVTRCALAGTNTTDYTNAFLDQQPLWMSLVFTVAVGPVLEEVAFRKILLDRLLFLGDVSALLLSSLFFGLFHTNLYQFLYAVLAGLVLGYVHIMTGRMVYNIALHAAINLCFGVLVEYLPEGQLDMAVYVCILSVPAILMLRRPWAQLYPGPMNWFTAREKLAACLSAPAFWICVAFHLTLSAVFILQ